MKHPVLVVAAVLSTAVTSLAQDAPPPPTEPAPPPIQRGLRVNAPGALDGYTLFSPLQSGTTFLVDMQGELVHRWDRKVPGNMAYQLDNGHVLFSVRDEENPRFFGGGLAGRIVEYDWDGTIVWDYSLSNAQRVLHHDLELLPNGNILAIAWEGHTRDDAIALGRDPKATHPKDWWPDAILELQPMRPNDAKIVWEWRAKEHLVQDFDRTKPGFGSVPEHPELLDINADHRHEAPMTPEERKEHEQRLREMRALGYAGGTDEAAAPKEGEERPPEADWMHSNGLDYDAAHDLIVFSSPHMCEVFVIDHSTTTEQARTHTGGKRGRGGDLLYRWGAPMHYGAGAKSDQKLFYQHDPQWVATPNKDELRITLFNNGMDRPAGKFSSVDELVLPFDPVRGFTREKATAFGPTEPAWSYTAPERESMYSFFISGAQRLSNGNTLICVGASGRFVEVTREGRVVWEYWNPYGGEIPHSMGKASPPPDPERKSPVEPVSVFQATRIPKDHPGLRGRVLTPLEGR